MKRPLAWLALLLLGACGSTPEPGPDPLEPADSADAAPAEDPAEVDVAPGEDGAKPAGDPAPAHPWESPEYRSATSRGGAYTIKWRPTKGADVPKNEHFEVLVWLFRTVGEGEELEPVPDARLVVSGWMPDHGHGMIRQPQAIDQGDGSYLVRGMLFHMGGHWQLFFDVIEDGLSERTDFEFEL